MGISHLQEPIRRPYGYPFFQWIQIRKGTARLETLQGWSVARAGDGIFLLPDEFHSYHDPGRGEALQVDWMAFDGEGVERALKGGPLGWSGVYRLADPGRIHALFFEAWDAANESGAGTGYTLSGMVYKLLMELARAASTPGRASTADGVRRLGPALELLSSRLADPWTSDSLAKVLDVSPQHLGRLFRRFLGQTLSEYLVRLRMNRALTLLLDRPDLRIHEIASALGYVDANYFIRLFKKQEGQTPGQFRTLHSQG